MKQRALITGASRGIGAAIANKLCEDGFTVYGTSTSGKGKTEGVNEWIPADFSTQQQINDFLNLIEQMPPFDVLVNNAGINIIKSQNDVTKDDYSLIENINLRAPYQVSQSISRKMAVMQYGRIIHIGSIWSVVTKAHRSLYSTMKTALIDLLFSY